MKYPCIESTIDIPFKKYLIRLWIDRKSIEESYDDDKYIADSIRYFLVKNVDVWNKKALIDYVAKKFSKVNAIQIKENKKEGREFGVVAYLVDFSSDVHG